MSATPAVITKPQDKVNSVRQFLEKLKPQLALALPKHLTPDRLARITLTAMLKNPRLFDCEPASLAGALLTCAQMGLEIDGREAHLVPFRNRKRDVLECSLIPGYFGLMKVARQSKEIKTFDFREVRAGDDFSYQYGSNAFLKHVPADKPDHFKDDKGEWQEREITHCYAVAVMVSGEPIFDVMRREDIEWHRDRYSKAAGEGPWVSNFAEMGAKTCVRMLAKRLPYSYELQRATDLDARVEQGLSQELAGEVVAIPEAVETVTENGAGVAPPTKLDQLTETLKGRKGENPAGTPAPVVPAAVSDPPVTTDTPQGATGQPGASDDVSDEAASVGAADLAPGPVQELKAPIEILTAKGPDGSIDLEAERQAWLERYDKVVADLGLKPSQRVKAWQLFLQGYSRDTATTDGLRNAVKKITKMYEKK